MGICHIAGAAPGPLAPFTPGPGDLVIAADGGYEALARLGVIPDIVMGDFDSLGSPPRHPRVLAFPREKDATDMMLAARHGFSNGYRAFRLYGGLGGRLDHTLANLQVLTWLARRGARGVLLTETTGATVLRGEGAVAFEAEAKGTLSVFALDAAVRGVTLRGLAYPLSGATLANDDPLGVSNAFIGQESSVSVGEGCLLVMWSGDAKER